MPASDLPFLRGEVRRLNQQYLAGGWDAFEGFYQLASLLLTNTVVARHGSICLSRHPDRHNAMFLGGWRTVTDPLPLTNGGFLRYTVTLYLDADTNRLKVERAAYQYQLTADNSSWVFRYDYTRTPVKSEPGAHLQLRGSLIDPPGGELQDLRFPTGRVSIEAVIRLLVESFGVPCAEWQEKWREVLATSEEAFLRIAHQPI